MRRLFHRVTNLPRLIDTVTQGSTEYEITFGSTYIAIEKPEPIMSGSAVKGVTDAVRAVADVGKLANDVKAKVERDVADVTDALKQTEEFSNSLRDAGAELRGALGLQSNHPPADN